MNRVGLYAGATRSTAPSPRTTGDHNAAIALSIRHSIADRYAVCMPDATSDSARWSSARAVAAELAETGVDPLDVQAAQAARTILVRRFVLDLLLIFSIVAVAAPVVLMVVRAFGGGDPIDGREIWIASAALLLLLAVVAARSIPSRTRAGVRARVVGLRRARVARSRRKAMTSEPPVPPSSARRARAPTRGSRQSLPVVVKLDGSAASAAAPRMPALLRCTAGTIGVVSFSSGRNSWSLFDTPPPTMNSVGENSNSSFA